MSLIDEHIQNVVKQHLKVMEQHTLIQVKQDTYFMGRLDTNAFSTHLSFLPGHIAIYGDFCPDRNGVISSYRYGLQWFSSDKSPDYLCQKFLESKFTLDRLHKEASSELAKDSKNQEFWKALMFLEEEDPFYVRELADEYGVYIESLPGWGYDISDQAALIAIHKKFVELYAAFPKPAMAGEEVTA